MAEPAAQPSRWDAGGLYSVALTLVIIAAMAAAVLGRALRSGPVIDAMVWMTPWPRQLAVMAVGVLAALALGAVRGPVMAEPFRVALALEGPAPWRVSLRRPLLRNWLGLGLTGLVLVVAGCGLAALAGAVTPGQAAAAAMGWLGAILAALAAWLAGQRWPLAGRVVGAGSLGLALVASTRPGFELVRGSAWWAAPAGIGALSQLLVVLISVTGLLAAAAAPALLSGLDPSLTLLQSERWSAASLAVRSGHVSEAGLAYEAWPARRVRRAARWGQRWWSRAIWLDLLAVARTPARLGAALAAIALAGAWMGRAAVMSTGAASGLGPATLAAVACVLAAAGIRGLSDGLFHVTEDASSPSSYGVAGWRLLGVHAVMPLAGTASALAIGGALGAGTGVRLLPVWLATAAALAALNVMERAKGPMPDALYVPMSSPMGDPAPIFRAAWQVWPELASAAWGILIVLVSGSLPPAMGTVAVVGAATALAAGCWPRLRGR